MPLHTDYRPTRLDDVAGNTDTIQILKVHLGKDNPNRSLLFIGPSGCGKTTLAMCVANELGSMDKWNFQMLNASDFRGIDTVRDLREQATRKPIGGSACRVWLMDECHKLTQDAQEAILKLLEDPPKGCWFLMATTNPEKLKITLRRRCTEFPVSPIDDKDLNKLLVRVIRRERKRVPEEVLKQICLDSLGAPGMALNVLDKVIDLPEKDMLKSAKRWAERTNNVVTLCRHMLACLRKKGGWKETLTILKELQEEDPETIRRQVLSYFAKVMLDGNESAYLIIKSFQDADCYKNGISALISATYEALSNDNP